MEEEREEYCNLIIIVIVRAVFIMLLGVVTMVMLLTVASLIVRVWTEEEKIGRRRQMDRPRHRLCIAHRVLARARRLANRPNHRLAAPHSQQQQLEQRRLRQLMLVLLVMSVSVSVCNTVIVFRVVLRQGLVGRPGCCIQAPCVLADTTATTNNNNRLNSNICNNNNGIPNETTRTRGNGTASSKHGPPRITGVRRP